MSVEISEYDVGESDQSKVTLSSPNRVQPSMPVTSFSVQSEALQSDVARIVVRADCRLAFGANPVASGSSEFWPSGRVEERFLGEGLKVAAIVTDAIATPTPTPGDRAFYGMNMQLPTPSTPNIQFANRTKAGRIKRTGIGDEVDMPDAYVDRTGVIQNPESGASARIYIPVGAEKPWLILRAVAPPETTVTPSGGFSDFTEVTGETLNGRTYRRWRLQHQVGTEPGSNVWVDVAGGTFRYYDCREESYGSDLSAVWTEEYIQECSRFGHLRFLDYTGMNGNVRSVAIPNDRPFSTDVHPDRRGYSLEDAIDLCNSAGCDLWWLMLKNSPQSYVDLAVEMIHANLNPSLSAYMEVDNEFWNAFFPIYHASYEDWYAEHGVGLSQKEAQVAHQAERHERIMGWLATKAAEIGASVGFNGRFRRVLGEQTGASINRFFENYPVTIARSDYAATAPYFGAGAATNPVPTTDVTTIHQNMLFGNDSSIEDVTALAKADAAYFASKGLKYIIYEANSHLLLSDVGLSNAVHNHPNMYDIFNHYLSEFRREVPDAKITLFNHIGPITGSGPWGLYPALPTPARGVNPRGDALDDALAGIYLSRSLALAGNPNPGDVGSVFSFFPRKRFGSVQPGTWAISSVPTGFVFTAATGELAGSSSGRVANTAFTGELTWTYTDASGSAALTRTIIVSSAAAYDDYDVRGVTTPPQKLSANGWSGVTDQHVARDGGVYLDDYTQPSNALRPIAGSGLNRTVILNFHFLGAGAEDRVLFAFSGGLNARVLQDGAVQLLDGDLHKATLGTVETGAIELRLEVRPADTAGKKLVKILVNGNQLGSTFFYTLGSNDTDNASYGFAAFNLGLSEKAVFNRIRGIATT